MTEEATNPKSDDEMSALIEARRTSLAHLCAETYQDVDELADTARLMAADPPGVVLEIGTACGGWLWVMRPVMAAHVDILTVDPDTCGRLEVISDRVFAALRAEDAARQTAVTCFRRYSEDADLPDLVRDWLAGREVDLLMIDGDHRYEFVKRDWETFGPMVRAGGLVLFHDINPGPEGLVRTPSDGAPRFWREEMASRAGAGEIVARAAGEGFGVGTYRVEG